MNAKNTTTQYILNNDSLEVLKQMQDNSIDLILTDPPYFNTLASGEHGEQAKWDRQWKNVEDFINLLELYIIEFKRVLKPSGHLFIFNSTWQNIELALILKKHNLDILNNIIWFKESDRKATGCGARINKESLTKYLTQREHILYAGNYAKYKNDENFISIEHQLDLLKRKQLEPLIKYFIESASKNNFTSSKCKRTLNNQMYAHYFTSSQYTVPSLKDYTILVNYIPELMINYITNEKFNTVEEAQKFYKNEYKQLNKNNANKYLRIFNATKEIFYSDVWTYKIPRFKDRHVCEKPLEMMLDIIKTTTLENHTVLDAFAGSGVVGEACAILNRNFIGIEMQEEWANKGNNRIRKVPNVI